MTSPQAPVPPGFLRSCGAALAAAGVLVFLINAGVSPLLPSDAAFSETASTRVFAWRMALATLNAVLLVFGSLGLYLRQASRFSGFGTIAFVLAFVGSVLLVATEWAQLFLVRDLAIDWPRALDGLDGGEAVSRYSVGFLVALVTFTLGWLALAVATARAGVLSRRGALLVVAGFVVIPVLGGVAGLWGMIAGNGVLGAGGVLLGWEIFRGESARPGR